MTATGTDNAGLVDRARTAQNIATRATEIALRFFQDRGNLHTQSKKAAMDLVTEADRTLEDFIRAELSAHYPSDGFLGEETGGAQSENLWIVDPLDGTANFLAGLPFWCISIGFVRQSKPVIGVISVPVLGELFVAIKGRGATCNGVPIEVSKTTRVDRSRIIYGRSVDLAPEPALAFAEKSMRAGALVYVFGCCAFNMTRIANGSCDLYFEERVFPWDAAAGVALVTEAGGRAAYQFDADAIASGKEIRCANSELAFDH